MFAPRERVLSMWHVWRNISTASASSARSWRGSRMMRECLGYRAAERITLCIGEEGTKSQICLVSSHDGTFSLCGKLVGHLPVGGWLHVAVAFIKRRTSDITTGWYDKIDNAPLNTMIKEVLTRMHKENLAQGRWCVDGQALSVCVDASSLTTGVSLVYNGVVVEDACWLRPEKDSQY